MTVLLQYKVRAYTGLAADPKPLPDLAQGPTFGAGSSFLETDTSRLYLWDGASWRPWLANPQSTPAGELLTSDAGAAGRLDANLLTLITEARALRRAVCEAVQQPYLDPTSLRE